MFMTTGKAKYAKRNNEVLSRKYVCSGKAILIKYYDCVFVLLLSYLASKSQLFCTALYCHLLPLKFQHIFQHYLTNGTILETKS